MKTWQGRIRTGADPLFEAFTSSINADTRLGPYDIAVSQAHAAALARAGIITAEEVACLQYALDEIAAEMAGGEFSWRDDLEDVHTHIEARLREKIGEVADTLHAGRSRNDQIAADLRLYVRDSSLACLQAILALQEALLSLAGRYREAVMPGYTHLQQAQPVLIAQPLLAHVAMLGRDWERFRDAMPRITRSPLGAGALAGSTFPLDRDFLATQCGFSGIMVNSLDAVSDRDFLLEFVSTAALCMTHLARFSEDLVLWCSTEFGFVRLPDGFASGSSMMPQKLNPDVAELIRGKCALVIGDLTAAMTLVKGLPLGYNRDLQEGTVPLYHAADTVLASLRILAAMMPGLTFDTGRTAAAISTFSLATDLADHLVQQGMPFRQAHQETAALVARCIEQGVDLDTFHSGDGDVPQLTAEASVERKRTVGSTHPVEVRRQIEASVSEIAQRRAWLEEWS